MTARETGGTGLDVRGVTVRFGDTVAVDDVSTAVPPGRVLAVLGPSGCGKSTLLRAVAGLEDLAAGTVRFDGSDLAGVPTHRRGFALMFQEGQLFAHLDVAGNVTYPLKRRRVARSQRAHRVGELLDMVGLAGYEHRRVATLSGGEQQRVALARALAVKPRLLLLDEPLSALDRSLRERLAGDLRDVLTATGTSALLVTHDHDEAFTVADDMAVMRQGRLVQQGTTSDVWRHPADADVARFLGYDTLVTGDAVRRLLAAAPPLETSGRGGSVAQTLALRQAALRVDESGPLTATVTAATARKDGLRLVVDVDDVGIVPAFADETAEIGPGQRVRLRLSPAAVAQLPG